MLDLFRLLLVVVLAMHGAAHVAWFLASWTRFKVGFGDGSWLLPGDVTIRSAMGKLFGLLALVVAGIFVFAALGLLLEGPWWAPWAQVGVFLSFGVVLPWFREAPRSLPLNLVVADIILMFILATSDILGLPAPVAGA